MEELRNNDKIKEVLDTTKVIKNQILPKVLKEYSPLLHTGNTQHIESQNVRIKDMEYLK